MKALITGGTSGLGQGVAYQLAEQGWNVTIVGRNLEKGEKIANEIHGNYVQADLSLVSENIKLATTATEPLDALILCAGALFNKEHPLTQEGLEATFALNYLSRFVLSQMLFSRINPNGRIIMVAGNGNHKKASTNWAHKQSGLDAAFKAALAVDLYAAEFARRNNQVQIHTCYPGWVKTNLLQNSALPMRLFTQFLGSSVEKGSSHLVRLVTGFQEEIHWNKSEIMQFSPPLPSGDEAKLLWDYSEQLINANTAVF